MRVKEISTEGNVALVTGASGGLGEHFARVLASTGASVIIGARQADRLAALEEDIRADGGNALAVELDVTSPDDVENALDAAEAAFGIVDILISNAGVAKSERFGEISEESWRFVMDANLDGVWRVGQAVVKRLKNAGQPGSIVNIASILGLGIQYGEVTYATSKAAVVQLTRAMALELVRDRVRVNALCPGYFRSEMTNAFFESERGRKFLAGTTAKRLGKHDELDIPLLMLASDAGSFITGAALPVDGGHLLRSL